jgi:hypothetical protein
MKLLAEEHDLVGRWFDDGKKLAPDETSSRIDRLVDEYLSELGTDPSGWDTLYRDPNDGRLWELTYPQSDTEGGGPPRLTEIDAAAARTKYGNVPGAE